jgi:hypothetical protein
MERAWNSSPSSCSRRVLSNQGPVASFLLRGELKDVGLAVGLADPVQVWPVQDERVDTPTPLIRSGTRYSHPVAALIVADTTVTVVARWTARFLPNEQYISSA